MRLACAIVGEIVVIVRWFSGALVEVVEPRLRGLATVPFAAIDQLDQTRDRIAPLLPAGVFLGLGHGVESLARALNDGLGREGRVILGGDASFSLIHRRLSPDEERFLERHGSLSTIATTRGMARAASGDATLVEIKAVEPSWPRIGVAGFAPSISLDEALSEKDGAFGAAVEEALLARLKAHLESNSKKKSPKI